MTIYGLHFECLRRDPTRVLVSPQPDYFFLLISPPRPSLCRNPDSAQSLKESYLRRLIDNRLVFDRLLPSFAIHYLKGDIPYAQRVQLCGSLMVSSGYHVNIKTPYPSAFFSRFSRPGPLKTRNPAPPPVFAPIPNIVSTFG